MIKRSTIVSLLARVGRRAVLSSSGICSGSVYVSPMPLRFPCADDKMTYDCVSYV